MEPPEKALKISLFGPISPFARFIRRSLRYCPSLGHGVFPPSITRFGPNLSYGQDGFCGDGTLCARFFCVANPASSLPPFYPQIAFCFFGSLGFTFLTPFFLFVLNNLLWNIFSSREFTPPPPPPPLSSKALFRFPIFRVSGVFAEPPPFF